MSTAHDTVSVSSKRPAPTLEPHNSGVPRKRRARYAWRACDVCRRRKGRCDGRKPCEFCHSRAIDCRYSPEPEAGDASGAADGYGDDAGPPAAQTAPLQKGESIAHLVFALQGQLDSLVAHIETTSDAHSLPAVAAHSRRLHQSIDLDASASGPLPHDSSIPSVAAVPKSVKHATRRFHGPTSPDYSLNAAEIKLRRAQSPPGGTALQHENNPSLEDEQTDEDEYRLVPEDDGFGIQSRLTTTRLRQHLLQLQRLLPKDEMIRLSNVYQGVIGHLHPVLDIKGLIERAKACYMQAGTDHDPTRAFDASSTQENTILILFLVLAIALCAETVSQSYVGKTLYKSVQYLIKVKLASEVSCSDHVVIAFLTVCHLILFPKAY